VPSHKHDNQGRHIVSKTVVDSNWTPPAGRLALESFPVLPVGRRTIWDRLNPCHCNSCVQLRTIMCANFVSMKPLGQFANNTACAKVSLMLMFWIVTEPWTL
jgi:hypothetical protein